MNAELHDYLRRMVDANASDLFFSVGAPPALKIDGRISPLGPVVLSAEAVDALARQAMNERQQREFEETMEMNLAIDMPGAGRFRINLPPVLHDLALLPRGLVLVVGAAGAGKSTTLASMIDHLNLQKAVHVITVEDPIEYLHAHKKSIVDQREVGLDTRSYANALRNTMREAPDVLMIGEIRDQETMQAAIAYAETGHLCLATLHANNANQALDRIQNFFPADARDQLWMDLSLNLKAMIAQQLIPTVDGQGRRAAVEILINTPLVSDIIRKGEVHALKELMERSTELGMQTFDQSLYQLYCDGVISYEHALSYADSQNNMRLMIKMGTQTGGLGRAAGLSIDDTTENTGQFFGKRP